MSWKSNRDGNHFRSRRRVGISSDRNSDYSSGTQSSPIHPSTHKSPKESETGMWKEKYIDPKKHQRALDTIRQGRDNINTDAYQSSDEAELLSCTLNLNDALQNHASTDEAWKAAKELRKLVKGASDETKQKYSEEINTIVNYGLKTYYDNSEYMYRGTGAGELHNMVKYKKIGAGGGGFDHVPISVFLEASTKFANDKKGEDRVLITFYKNRIKEDVIFQGYDVNTPYNSEGTYKPQGMIGVHDGEFRIRDKTVPYEGKIRQVKFFGKFTDKERQEIRKHYNMIESIVFDSDKNVK